jgi:hypothetical protein
MGLRNIRHSWEDAPKHLLWCNQLMCLWSVESCLRRTICNGICWARLTSTFGYLHIWFVMELTGSSLIVRVDMLDIVIESQEALGRLI